MKKIASRVLALVVALSMLLTATAFAAERNTAVLSIGDFSITMGEETLSLPVTLSIGGGADLEGQRGYATANVYTETATALTALAAFENGEIKAYLNGMNYGFTIPLEQLISLIEEEMGMTFEEAIAEAMGSVDPAMMDMLTGMMESTAALESSAAALETYKAFFDALASSDPAVKAYLDEYFGMINEMLATTGEEMTIEDILSMITIGLTCTSYEAEAGALIDFTMTLTVEEETIEIPFSIVTLTDEAGTYGQFSMVMDADGETVYFEIYADGYAEEGVDYTNFSLTAAVGDTDAEEYDVEMLFSLSTQNSEDGVSVGAEVYASEYGDLINLGFLYAGDPVVSTETADSYDGFLLVYGEADGESFEATAATNLTLSNVPEGELLTFTQSVNPLEADEETMAQAATDAMNALIQGAGVLMQDPTIASMIGGLMG